MDRLHQLTILAILLTTTSQLLSSADAVNAQNRRHRNRPVAKPSAKDANCQDMSEEQLMRDYVKEVSGAKRMGMHESFYQMEALREAFREESFEAFRNESRGLVHIARAPIDSESHEKLDCTEIVKRDTEKGKITTDRCPMSWVVNVDRNRVPRVLVEAQCLACSDCLAVPLREAGDTGPFSRSRCSEVRYYTKVLRKTHSCQYVPIWEPVTVGCACRGAPSRESINQWEDQGSIH